MVGRKPAPTRLKLLRGNPGKRPLNQHEPQVKVETPHCPRELTPDAKKEWRRIVPALKQLGILSKLDGSALAAYCQSKARWLEAERKISETGLVVKTTNGNVIENPYYSISKRERELMHRFLSEFGMTPVSRTRINIESQTNKDNRFAEFG